MLVNTSAPQHMFIISSKIDDHRMSIIMKNFPLYLICRADHVKVINSLNRAGAFHLKEQIPKINILLTVMELMILCHRYSHIST